MMNNSDTNQTNSQERSIDYTIVLSKGEFSKSDNEFTTISIPELSPNNQATYRLKIRSIGLEGDENLLPNRDKYDDYGLDILFYIQLSNNGILFGNIAVRYDDIKPCSTEETLSSVIDSILKAGISHYNLAFQTSHEVSCIYLRDQKIMEYEIKHAPNSNDLSAVLYTTDYQPG